DGNPLVANADTFHLYGDHVIVRDLNELLGNDTIPLGSNVSVSIVQQPATSLASVAIDSSNSTFSITPAANANGTSTFVYTISDDQGNSDSATVTLTISPLV